MSHRSLHGPVGQRHAVAALLILALTLPVTAAGPGPHLGSDAAAGPSRFAAVGRTPGSPVMLRPTDGSADPQGHGYTWPSQHLCGPHLCVHWVNATSDAPPPSDRNGNGVPDQVDATLHAFETAWRVEVVRMGFRAPKPDGSSADHGPNDELDVYLADVGALGLSGYARIDVRMDAEGHVYVLEANPNPQIAHAEDFSDSAEKAGYSYKDLLQELLNIGLRWRPAKAA